MPKTRAGKWSVGLIAAVPLLFFLGGRLADTLYAPVRAGNTLGGDLAARPVLALAAGLTAVGVGATLVLFLVGEFVGPH
jgi:hypothetical protein